MSNALLLQSGHVGILNYTIKNAEGETLDSTVGQGPRPYLHGADNMLPGLEKELEGKSAGDKLNGVLAPADAFGEHDGSEPQRVKRSELPKGRNWQKGMPFAIKASDGTPVQLWITDVRGAWVWVTPNHPLAGTEVHYEVEVIRVRTARQVEIDHGHPHGLDGTQSHH